MFPVYTDVHYQNLRWDPFKIDIEKAQLNYTHMVIDDTPVVYTELPVIKHWSIAFEYMYKMLRTHTGEMDIEVNDASAIATTALKATTDGHIFPYLHDLQIDIDGSRLYHKDWWKQFWYRQYFDIGKYILQNAYNLFGHAILNRNLYTISTRVLNDQIHKFPMKIPQLGKEGQFNLNWRLTADPEIHDHELDLAFFFDIGPEMERCMVPHDTHNYYF